MFLDCLYIKPKQTSIISLFAVQNAYNRCVLFHVLRELNHDLCGGVTELHVLCGR